MRRFSITAFFGPAVLAVGPLCFFLACDFLKWSPVDKYTEIYIILAPLFAFFPVVGILAYWGQRRYQVLCPHCGQSLMSHYPVVVANGKCSYCHKSIIDASA
jgi:ribosomal protein S27AE